MLILEFDVEQFTSTLNMLALAKRPNYLELTVELVYSRRGELGSLSSGCGGQSEIFWNSHDRFANGKKDLQG